jgi:hypothetical protein
MRFWAVVSVAQGGQSEGTSW